MYMYTSMSGMCLGCSDFPVSCSGSGSAGDGWRLGREGGREGGGKADMISHNYMFIHVSIALLEEYLSREQGVVGLSST